MHPDHSHLTRLPFTMNFPLTFMYTILVWDTLSSGRPNCVSMGLDLLLDPVILVGSAAPEELKVMIIPLQTYYQRQKDKAS